MSFESLYTAGKAISETGIYKKEELLFKHFPGLKIEKTTPPLVKQRNGLITKIFLLYMFLTLVIALMFVIGVFGNRLDNIRLITESSARQLTNEVAAELQLIRPAATNLSKKQKRARVLEAVEAFNQLDVAEISEFVVLDFAKNKTYDDDDLVLLDNMPAGSADTALAELKDVTQAKIQREVFNKQAIFKFLDDGDFFQAFIPFSLVTGQVQVFITTLENKAFRREIDSTRNMFLFLIGFIVIMQAVFGFYLLRVLVRPIRQLQTSALTIAAGDLKSRIHLEGKGDELETLGESFNFMAHVLNSHRQEMTAYIDTLEFQAKIVHDELDMAASIQKGMLPVADETVRNLVDLGMFYQPLEKVSGDYYDLAAGGDGGAGVLLADASGHGIPAALITIMAKSGFSSFQHLLNRPAELLRELNGYMCRRITTDDFVSAFYVYIRPDNRIAYCNGGQNKIFLIRKNGNFEELDSQGFMLGILDDLSGIADYQSEETEFNSGDRLLLYTDGLIESANVQGEEFGQTRLQNFIARPHSGTCQQLVDELVAELNAFSGGEPAKDDITVICLERK